MTTDSSLFAREARIIMIQEECGNSRFLIEAHFDELKLLRTTIEDLVMREEAAELDQLELHAQRIPEHLRSDYWAENHPYWWDHIIAPQFRASYFITLMAAVELHIGRFVNDAGFLVQAPISVDDLRGDLYGRSRKFLDRMCGIKSPSESQWQRLYQYYAVRNGLVHAGGTVKKADLNKVLALANAVPGLVVENGAVEIKHGFNENAHRECFEFFSILGYELVQICRRLKRTDEA